MPLASVLPVARRSVSPVQDGSSVCWVWRDRFNRTNSSAQRWAASQLHLKGGRW
jgi:hypothetical protein